MTENPHPLDPATADEYLTGRKIMAAAGLLADPVRFAYYGLEEPPKADVLGGGPADRRVRGFLLKTGGGVAAPGLLADPVRFAYYGLEEPPKADVLGGGPADRRLRAFLLNTGSGEST